MTATKLRQLIDRLKSTPMNVGTLKSLLPPYAVFKKLEDLKAPVFGKHDCVVLLIPSKFSKIGHFVVLLKFPKYVEYFSSFGGRPESEMKLLGQHSDTLKRVLGRKYTYNSVELQSSSTTIQDCALFVLARIALRTLKLREFQQLFKAKIVLDTPDDIVSMLTALLLVDL